MLQDETVKLTEAEIVKLGIDICTALEVCSKKEIIHRDIKPENIFVNDFGDFKLGDFGIARKLEGQISNLSRKGTPNYMAPEVFNGKDYDARADIYSLGIVLYRYLNNNRLPFLETEEQIKSPVERDNASAKRLRGEKLPAPSNASAKMAEVVLRACAYNPNARFQDATQMKRALQSVLDAPAPKPPKRTGKIIAGIAAAVVLLGSAAALFATGALESMFPAEKEPEASVEPTIVEQEVISPIVPIIAEADALVQNQDYLGALAVIQAAQETYPDEAELAAYHSKLIDQISADKLNAAQELAGAGDYPSAIALLQDAIGSYGERPDFLTALENYQSEYTRTVREDVLQEVSLLTAGEDYLGALKAINNFISTLGTDEELTAKKEALETSYINQVMKQTSELLLLEDYDEADRIINAAREYLPTSEQLVAESVRVQNARPVYLLKEISPYKTPAHYSAKSTLTMGGTNYTTGFTCMGFGAFNEGNQTYFNLDGRYSMISFTAGIVSARGNAVTFLFHADGELVYKFTMHKGDKPTKHVFNIVGCKQFRISVYDNCALSEDSGIYGIADIIVKKNASTYDKEAVKLSENQVYLLDEMRPYKVPSHYEDSSILSMGGQNYAHGFSCMGYGAFNSGNKTYFNLDGKYSKITFTTGIVLDRGLGVEYRFYTDGKLAHEVKLKTSDLATTHSFSVEGCKQLLICVYDTKLTADASGTYGIAEIIMDKSSSYNDSDNDGKLGSGEYYLLDEIKPHNVPTRYDDKNVLTMGGKHYSHGFSCMGNGYNLMGNQTYFKLDGKYKEISFIAGTILDRGHNVTFRFMADGKQVYEFKMKEGDLPTKHKFSVEGYSELIISVSDFQPGADTSGTYGLGNIIVTK